MHIPVFGNGDVNSPEKAKAMREKRGIKEEEKKAKRWWDDDGDGKGWEEGEVSGKFKKKKVKETDCPECGKPGKQKLMACASCGCK